jgi:hypothetical protein
MPYSGIEHCGTNIDGSPNPDYCHHCFKDGDFTSNISLEQMIERCIPFMLHDMSEKDARASLEKQLPALKRWNTSDT